MWKSILLAHVVIVGIAVHGNQEDKAPSQPSAASICSILSNAPEYDGKEITVSGVYKFEIHGSELFGQACRSRNNRVNLRNSPNYQSSKEIRKAWDKNSQHGLVNVVLRGKFSIAQKGHCFGAACDAYEIEVQEYLFVRPEGGSAGGPGLPHG